MKTLLFLLSALLLVSGCATATRTSIPPEESHYHFVVRHSHPMQQAFDETKLALAESFYDVRDVLPFSQLSSGTFIVNGTAQYRVGGAMGQVQYAPFRLKIVVSESTVTLDFDLGREQTSGWFTYPPKTEMPGIRSQFESLAAAIAGSVKGSLESSTPASSKESST